MIKQNKKLSAVQRWSVVLLVLAFIFQPDVMAQKKRKNSGKDENYIYQINKRELDIQGLFIEAVSEKELGNTEDAIGLFNAVLKLDPDNHAAYYELARMAYENNDLFIAEEFASKAVRIHPNNEWYHIYLAESRAHQGNYKGAAEGYQALVDAMPDKWEYLQDVGYMYARAEEYDEAIRVYDELEEQEGITEPLSLQKQAIYIKMGKVEKAADEIRKAIGEFPDRENLYILLAEIYEANGYHKKALESYDLLLKRIPDHPLALLASAEILRKTGNEKEYRETVQKVFGNAELDIDTKILMFIPYIQEVADNPDIAEDVLAMAELIRSVHPDDAKSITAYADVLLNIGRKEDAVKAYKEAAEYEDSPITIWVQLFDLFVQDENYTELREYGEKAADRFPGEIAPYFYLGAACLQMEDYNCAVEKYGEGLRIGNINPEIAARMWSSMGDAYNEMKDHARSDSCYDEALIINPNDAFTLNNYAYYLSLRDDQLEKAEKMSKRSNLLVEDNSAFLDTYAWIMYKLEDYKTAREWMEKAIKVMEDEGQQRPVLLEHYGDILFKLGNIEAALENWNKALEAGGDKTDLEAKIKNKALPD
jgi:tetratricopeptide (TPR) repeat protein